MRIIIINFNIFVVNNIFLVLQEFGDLVLVLYELYNNILIVSSDSILEVL